MWSDQAVVRGDCGHAGQRQKPYLAKIVDVLWFFTLAHVQHGGGGECDLCCHRPPGHDSDILASFLGSCHVVHLSIQWSACSGSVLNRLKWQQYQISHLTVGSKMNKRVSCYYVPFTYMTLPHSAGWGSSKCTLQWAWSFEIVPLKVTLNSIQTCASVHFVPGFSEKIDSLHCSMTQRQFLFKATRSIFLSSQNATSVLVASGVKSWDFIKVGAAVWIAWKPNWKSTS